MLGRVRVSVGISVRVGHSRRLFYRKYNSVRFLLSFFQKYVCAVHPQLIYYNRHNDTHRFAYHRQAPSLLKIRYDTLKITASSFLLLTFGLPEV